MNFSTTDAANSTKTKFLTDSEEIAYNVLRKGTVLAIIFLGSITNSLVLVVLARTRIGCITTKIILLFLAISDFLALLLELFLSLIPNYWQLFPIYYDGTCGIAGTFRMAILTSSTWYLTLVTTERFIAVRFPLKARSICTKKKAIIVCCCIPVVSFVLYLYFINSLEPVRDNTDGYIFICAPLDTLDSQLFKLNNQIWITAYFFLPSIAIVTLNALIVWTLKQARKATDLPEGNISGSPQFVANKWKAHRKATNTVMIASIAFVVLMIPRGILTTLFMDVEMVYDSPAELFADIVALNLQLLNHAINFFIYILANDRFRTEFCKIFLCSGRCCSKSSVGDSQELNNTCTSHLTGKTED
ncbi:cysteinyl leukotriene receptor 2-like [Watersipora subatra]|uniref:cysteinyl leukotriene receptor 2-like n=1 Tax=Watersipora subatra TaxID=2589382 RepID=UPI00355BEE33